MRVLTLSTTRQNTNHTREPSDQLASIHPHKREERLLCSNTTDSLVSKEIRDSCPQEHRPRQTLWTAGLASTDMGSSTLITELAEHLTAVARQFESSHLGLYLHGSHSRDQAGPRSDIDVLGLCSAGDDTAWQAAQRACLDALSSRPWHDRLDLKVVDADEFAGNPWVDLRRARRLTGFAWHETLPERTRDQAGRESLGVLAVLFEDDDFAQRTPHQLRKPVGRLCSVLAALVTGTVPQSSAEAVRLLGTDSRLKKELRDLRDALAQLPDDSIVTEELSSRVQQAAAAVAEVLRVHVEYGLLGPSCTAAGARALAMRRST